MATTTERGIAVLETTDEVTHANINLISASTDAALAEQEPRQIYTVANVAERTALAGTFQPTANKPLYVHRVNAGSGRQLERTINGTTWETIPTETRETWNHASLIVSATRVNSVVTVFARWNESVAAGAVQEILPSGGLPVAFRPTTAFVFPAGAYGAAAQSVIGGVEPNGRIVCRNTHTASLANITIGATYIVNV